MQGTLAEGNSEPAANHTANEALAAVGEIIAERHVSNRAIIGRVLPHYAQSRADAAPDQGRNRNPEDLIPEHIAAPQLIIVEQQADDEPEQCKEVVRVDDERTVL